MAYLVEHRTAVPQYRSPRREVPIGVVVVHTAESILDTVGPDTGAENVASYMTRRTDPGSYHDLADADTTVHLVPYEAEAFHIGTHRLNRRTTGLSFACRTTDWPRMTPAQRRAFLRQGAQAAVRQVAYHRRAGGVVVPTRRITLADALAGRPGYLAHADGDPARRSDPGALFPWDEFFDAVTAAQSEEDDMPLTDADVQRIATAVWQRAIPWPERDSNTASTVADILRHAGRHADAAAQPSEVRDAITAALATATAPPALDADALAQKVADLLATRLQS